MNNICRNFNLLKIRGDLTTDDLSGSYDLIYFDAFGPDKQPEMWTTNIFARISGDYKIRWDPGNLLSQGRSEKESESLRIYSFSHSRSSRKEGDHQGNKNLKKNY